MKTFLNKNGNAIIRRCENCKNWTKLNDDPKSGYCQLLPLIFAYTLQPTVFAVTRRYYLCETGHQFVNEEHLLKTAQQVEANDIIRPK
jgi:hypothetical protein